MSEVVNENNNVSIVKPVDISYEMKRAFIEYSMSVIIDRALPDIRDGLKPVHRRILYSMFEQGITPDKKYVKCASTVGDVLGKYHPHGDAAVYDSLVRMAQDFSMRYPTVDGHGNFGSRDGDAPAAYRYTESKLAKISMELLADIKKNTVDFKPNFDERYDEPVVLPARFPNLLVNGSMGIAVAMATNIPPHNLREVIDGVNYVIDNPDASIDDIMQFIKGPDFPTAANIVGRQGIREAYRTGRGRIVVRGEANIEQLANGRQRIVITELPYQVNNAGLVEKIAELAKDKRIDGIADLSDEYGKEGIRIVIDLKKDANANVVLNQLYKNTQLQDAFNVNMVAIVETPDHKYEPKQVNLKEMIDHYIAHQKDVVRRRTKFDLDKAEARAHLLEGCLIALDHLDEVIRIIRSSRTEELAKQGLMEAFNFTDKQAQYIVDMRLGRLTGLEREKIQNEYNELQEKIAYFKAVLADETLLLGIIKDELKVIADKYGDDRRTRFVVDEGEIDIDDLIHEQQIAVTLTHFGYVKRMPSDTYKSQRRGGKGIKGLSTREEDFVEHLFITSSHNYLLFFTNHGRVFKLKGYEIPEASRQAKGTAIVNLLQLLPGEKVATIIPLAEEEMTDDKFLIMATKEGLVKKTSLAEYHNIRKGGLIAAILREEDEMIHVGLADENTTVVLGTKDGYSIRFDQSDVRATGRVSQGVRGIDLREGDYVIGMDLCKDDSTLLVVTEKGFGKRTSIDEYKIQNRGGKGILTYRISDKTGCVAGMMMVTDDDDVMLITKDGTIIRIAAKEISIIGRATKGVTLMGVGEGGEVVSVAKTEHVEEEEEAVEDTAEGEETATEEAATEESGAAPEENA